MSKGPIIKKAESEEQPSETELSGEGKKLYRLRRPYWDGRMEHGAGDVLYFVPGMQPTTASLVEEEE
jgi:hypothetical protein